MSRPDADLAYRLTGAINARLVADEVSARDVGAIAAVVAEIAPGWEYIERTSIGDRNPSVVLTRYDARGAP